MIDEIQMTCHRAGIQNLETELAKLSANGRLLARFSAMWRGAVAGNCQNRASTPWAGVIDQIANSREIKLRILATADVDLARQVEQGLFRRDLYDNLSGAIIQLPSLRKRGTDEIAAFVGYGLQKYAAEQLVKLRGLDPNYDAKLLEADWSANNLRGLRNEIRRAVAYLRHDGIVTEADEHYESMVKATMGIGALGAAKRSFRSMDAAGRHVMIADAINRTISKKWPKGSPVAAPRGLSKSGLAVSLQTILNYVNKDLVEYHSGRKKYVASKARREGEVKA